MHDANVTKLYCTQHKQGQRVLMLICFNYSNKATCETVLWEFCDVGDSEAFRLVKITPPPKIKVPGVPFQLY